MSENRKQDRYFHRGFVMDSKILDKFRKAMGFDKVRSTFYPALTIEEFENRTDKVVGHRDRNGVFHALGRGSTWSVAINDAVDYCVRG